jgi:hypothetical protein
MSPLLALFGVTLVAALFFVVIPGVGATTVRRAWRQFRASIESASLLPTLRLGADAQETAASGSYRFFGSLEAIQGDDLMWLTDGRLTVGAHLGGVRVFLLTSPALGHEPQLLPWKRVYSLPAGTKAFVAGALRTEAGRRIFAGAERRPLLVLIYEGDDHAVMRRAIESGRGRNEYWNQFTVISLITGAFLLAVFGLVMLGEPRMRVAGLLSMVAATAPLALLLPPGVGAYFVYRRLWRRARALRAERDLARLPLRYFAEADVRALDRTRTATAHLPDGEPYVMASSTRARAHSAHVSQIFASNIIDLAALHDPGVYLFGTPCPPEPASTSLDAHAELVLCPPQDMQADLVEAHGHPAEVSLLAARYARSAALLSAVSIAVALSVNLLGVLLVLNIAIR